MNAARKRTPRTPKPLGEAAATGEHPIARDPARELAIADGTALLESAVSVLHARHAALELVRQTIPFLDRASERHSLYGYVGLGEDYCALFGSEVSERALDQAADIRRMFDSIDRDVDTQVGCLGNAIFDALFTREWNDVIQAVAAALDDHDEEWRHGGEPTLRGQIDCLIYEARERRWVDKDLVGEPPDPL